MEEDQGWLPNAPVVMGHDNNRDNRGIHIHGSKSKYSNIQHASRHTTYPLHNPYIEWTRYGQNPYISTYPLHNPYPKYP